MTESIAVRAVRQEDYAAWLPLWHGYNVFYGRAEGAPPEVTAATWGRFFDAYEPLWALVAADEKGRLVGFTHYLYHRNTNHLQPVCYLEDLFTAEAARGRGVGRALIDAVCDAAKAAGVTRVYWLTQEGNATARRLYDKVAQKSEFVVYGKEV